MALSQLFGQRDQMVDNAGNPLSGGLVNIYEPNTLTRVNSYSDSGLVALNANPVVLSGAGRSNIWLNRNVDIRITDKDANLIAEELGANPDSLGGESDSGLVPNGSFEIDTDSDDVPDGWTSENNAAGSSNQIDTSQSSDGANSYRTESTGSGGGDLVATDFFPVNETDDLRVDFDLFSTVATVRNIVRVEWYDVSQVSISDSDVYDSTANPATFTSRNELASPPAGARFAKVRILGGTTGGILAGITYWDNFNVFYPAVVSGVFDNITISGNQIISTNTNGDIILTPNGTGNVELEKDTNITGTLDVTAASTVVGLTASGDVICSSANAVDLTDSACALLIGAAAGQHLESDGNELQSKSDATTAATLFLNHKGGDVEIGAHSGTGGVQLWQDGEIRLVAGANGIVTIRSSGNTDAEGRSLLLQHADGTIRGGAGFTSDNDVMILRNYINSGLTSLQGASSGGVNRNLVIGDPDGSASLYHAGLGRVFTRLEGLTILGSSAGGLGANQDARFQMRQSDNSTDIALLAFLGTANLYLRNQNHGGHVRVEAEDTAGSVRLGFLMDPDVEASMYHPPTTEQVIRSKDSSAADNVTGADIRHFDDSFYDVGLGVMPTVGVTGATTVSQTHAHKAIRITSGAGAITFDNDADIPVDSAGWVKNVSGSANAITQGAGVTLNWLNGATLGTGNRVLANAGWFSWHKISDTVYDITGPGLT